MLRMRKDINELKALYKMLETKQAWKYPRKGTWVHFSVAANTFLSSHPPVIWA